MIDFAEKMSAPAVKLVHSHQEFVELVLMGNQNSGNANGNGNGVAFMVFDPKAKEVSNNTGKYGDELTSLVEKYLASTTHTQIFGQVARKLQDRAHFGLLHPGTASKADLQKFGLNGHGKGPFIVKVEENADPVVYGGELNSMDLLDFVKENNAALVTDLQGHNFRAIAQLGLPLFIGVVDSDNVDVTAKFAAELREVAKSGSLKGDYNFATMDGKKWSSFLKQFAIAPTALPQFLVLDVPKRMFYQNETFTEINAFVKGIKDGTIEQREQSGASTAANEGPMEKFHGFFVKYMPYTLFAVIALIGLLVYCVLGEDEDEKKYQELYEAQQARLRKAKEEHPVKKKPIKED